MSRLLLIVVPFLGAAFAFIDQTIFRGHLPFTLRNKDADHDCMQSAGVSAHIEYPKPDGVISFDDTCDITSN